MSTTAPVHANAARAHHQRKSTRAAEIFRSVLLTGAAIVGGASVLMLLAALLFGLRPQVVVSGSMEPQIPTGSMIVTRPVAASDVTVGDVVTVDRGNSLGLVTHRVVASVPSEGGASLTLQGDANASADPQPYPVSKAGLLILTVPWVGYVSLFLRTPAGIVALVALAGALVFAYFAAPKTPRSRHRRAPTA